MTRNKYKMWTQLYHTNDYSEPFIMTDGQADIFKYIYEPEYKRVGIKAVTQYGKSDVTSMAVIHLLTDHKVKILIVSPRIKQSQIIMAYIIQHFFDHPDLQAMLEIDSSLEKLKRERSKTRITLRNGSEVAILTADSRTVSQEAKSLMGFGADIVIIDESALIPEDMYSKIFRMVGGHKYNKIVQLGNPFRSDHFERVFNDDRYIALSIDYKQAIQEGRFTQDYIDEARETISPIDFKIFYECEFPDYQDMLFKNIHTVLNAEPQKPKQEDIYVMGVDLAKVEDYTVIAVYNRRTNKQVYQDRFRTLEWPYQKKKIQIIAREYNDALTVLDATGLGDPVADDLIRAGVAVEPIKLSNQTKKELIEKLMIWVEQEKVSMIPLKETREEFENFTYERTASKQIRYLAREGYHDDIVCFVAGTKVLTSRGYVNIENIKVGDMVLTRTGYEKVLKTSSRIADVITNKYLGLRGTPDHPVITKNGEVRLENACAKDILYIWDEKQSCIKEKNITDIQNQSIDIFKFITGGTINGKNPLLHFIGKSGSIIMEEYQKVWLSITKIKTLLTTILKTLRLWVMENITECIYLSLIEGSRVLRMAKNNRKDWLEISKHGERPNLKRLVNVENVAKSSLLNHIKINSSAEPSVNVETGEKDKEIVYNLTVENSPEYFVNNILVHNCAHALAVSALAPLSKKKEPEEPTVVQQAFRNKLKQYENPNEITYYQEGW